MTLSLSSWSVAASGSRCFGTTANGRLESGVKLPQQGDNFISYGRIPSALGRTYLHSRAAKVVVDAYAQLKISHPDKQFKYAETGFSEGGHFKPHRTHQNGLSIDFIVPVLNRNNHPVALPTSPLNRYGYDIEFTPQGEYEKYRIDFEAMAAHIVALHKTAEKSGIGIWRVLFDPKLQPYLYQTAYGDYIKRNITIPYKRSWVRHDDHYHVDFIVDCEPL